MTVVDGAIDDLGTGTGNGDPDPTVTPQDGPDAAPTPPPDLANLTDEQLANLPPEAQQRVREFQADYTRKTTALAEERKQLEERLGYVSWADEVQRTLEERGPEAAATLLDEMRRELVPSQRPAVDTRQASPGQPDPFTQTYQGAVEVLQSPDSTPYERQLAQANVQLYEVMGSMAQRLDQMEQQSQSTLRQFANNEITQTITTLHGADYKALEPDIDRFADTVLRAAKREGITNLTTAAKLAYHDTLVERARTTAASRAAVKSRLPDGEQVGSPGVSSRGEPKTVEEALARAKARLGNA